MTCVSHNSKHIIMFTDDTTVMDREEVHLLINWCDINNLQHKVHITKEVTVDFGKKHTPSAIKGIAVEFVKTTKFLSVNITDDLTWSTNTTSIIKKAQWLLHFHWWVMRADRPFLPNHLLQRWWAEHPCQQPLSLLHDLCSFADQKVLETVARTAESITRSVQSSIQPVSVSLPPERHQYHQWPPLSQHKD